MVIILSKSAIVALMVWDFLAQVYAFVMAMNVRDKPSALAPSPWPTIPSEDAVGETARQFVLNLTEAIGDKSIRAAASKSSVSHVTLLNILAGRVWPDLATITKLEIGLEASLWPPYRR